MPPALLRGLIRRGEVLPPSTAGETVTPDQPYYRAELQLEARDGREVWVADIALRVFDESGEVLYTLGMFRDITEQKQAEQALGALHAAEQDLRVEELRSARRHLLVVEKDALQEAWREGHVGQEAHAELLQSVDARLTEIDEPG